jgi:uridine phosphorylase
MTAVLGAALRGSGLAFRPGVSCTIDTPYRETVAEARHYQAEGVLCVEMEAAALFAVAEVRRPGCLGRRGSTHLVRSG